MRCQSCWWPLLSSAELMAGHFQQRLQEEPSPQVCPDCHLFGAPGVGGEGGLYTQGVSRHSLVIKKSKMTKKNAHAHKYISPRRDPLDVGVCVCGLNRDHETKTIYFKMIHSENKRQMNTNC